MSIKRKFLICSVVMLVIPVVLILLLSVILLAAFALLNPSVEFSLTEGISISDPMVMKFVVIWAAMALMVVLTTGAAITAYLSRSILHPLEELNTAMEHMKEGDLSYEFSGSSDAELQSLCRSFEELRLKLQTTVSEDLAREQEQRMLLANISHDIKTPITSIRGYVEGILDGVANTPEKLERYLKTIHAKAGVIELMADNLSLYSKLEMKRVLYHMEITDIFTFLREITEEFSLDLQDNDMALSYDIQQAASPGKLDREKMHRVFANLITNAIKYKKEGPGSLCISGRRTEQGALITFTDKGTGIASEDIERVFEGFYRGDPSRNNKIQGNGLGLSICRQIVQDHGGKIWIRSEKGEGTEVILLLPCLEKETGSQMGRMNTERERSADENFDY